MFLICHYVYPSHEDFPERRITSPRFPQGLTRLVPDHTDEMTPSQARESWTPTVCLGAVELSSRSVGDRDNTCTNRFAAQAQRLWVSVDLGEKWHDGCW